MPNYTGVCPVCGEHSIRCQTSYEYYGYYYQRPQELIDSLECIEGCEIPDDADIELEYDDGLCD